MQDIPAATESAGQAAAAVDGVFHVLTAGEEAEQEEQEDQEQGGETPWCPASIILVTFGPGQRMMFSRQFSSSIKDLRLPLCLCLCQLLPSTAAHCI